MSVMAVYFIQIGDDGPIKIGYVTNSSGTSNRFEALQSANPYVLRLLRVIPGTKQTEQEWHEKYKDVNIRGEWFEPSKELVDAIEEFKFDDGLVFDKIVLLGLDRKTMRAIAGKNGIEFPPGADEIEMYKVLYSYGKLR